MWLPAKALLWSLLLLATSVLSVRAWSREHFVESLLREYREVDQARMADANRDGLITSSEFQYSLYQQADGNGNRDDRVTLDEFVDYYAIRYNVTTELAVILFGVLNDPNSQDDVITPRDVSLVSFLGREYASIEEYRAGLEKWFRQAAEKLYHFLTSPHVIGRNQNEAPRYEGIYNVDSNRDGIVSPSEIREEISRYNNGNPVSRASWVKRTAEVFEADPVTSVLTFDLWDRDGDLAITSRDLPSALRDMDLNGDDRVTVEEFLKYTERGYKLSRKLSGRPIHNPMVACPVPWWSPNEITPTIDAIRATMDFDDDFDGWISRDDVTRWLAIFDANGDQRLDRDEYINQQTSRYGVNVTVASAMFDMADTNGDGSLNEGDWAHHFRDDIEVSFCDVRRSILHLVRLAGVFQDMQQGPGRRHAMQSRLREEWAWFLQNKMVGGAMGQPMGRKSLVNICQGRRACYEGEHTTAWGLPGASLWWGSSVNRKWGNEMMNPVSMRFPWSGVESTPFVPFRRSTYTQNPFNNAAKNQGSGDVSGSQSESFPFRQNSGDFWSSQKPGSAFSETGGLKSERTPQGRTNPFLKRYHQHLFGSARKDSDNGVPTSFDSTDMDKARKVNMGNNNLNRFPHGSTASFSNVQPFPTGTRLLNKGDRQGQESADASSPGNRNMAGGKTGTARQPPSGGQRGRFPFPAKTPMPVIGLSPVVLGLDPWLFGGYPQWRWNGKKKREKIQNFEVKPGSGDLENAQTDSSNTNIRVAREANVSEEQEAANSDSLTDSKKKASNNTGDGAHPWSAHPQSWNDPFAWALHLSPQDLWLSWMMEKFLWESMPNDTQHEQLNETDIDDMWERMFQWLQTELQKSDSKGSPGGETAEKKKETEQRSKRDTGDVAGDEQMDNYVDEISSESDLRIRRRSIESQRIKRNPYFNAVKDWVQRYGQMFQYFPFYSNDNQWPPWFQSTTRFQSPGPKGNNWMNNDWSDRTMRRKRHAAFNRGKTKEVGSADQLRRAFTFGNKWMKTKGSDNSRYGTGQNRHPYSPSTPPSNVWRGAVSQYGRENNWREHLKSESGHQWGSSAKEKIDFSDEKWLSGKDPMRGTRVWYSMMNNNPTTGNNWMQDLASSSNSHQMFKTNDGKGLPTNFAAFFIGRSPGNGFGNGLRYDGVGGNLGNVQTSRPWAVNFENNNRWQDYANQPDPALETLLPFNGNLYGLGGDGLANRMNPLSKRHVEESQPTDGVDDTEGEDLKRDKRDAPLSNDDVMTKVETDSRGEEGGSRPKRRQWPPFPLNPDDYAVCHSDTSASSWRTPWRGWNFIKFRFGRQSQRSNTAGNADDQSRRVLRDRSNTKRHRPCFREGVSYSGHSLRGELSRLRHMLQWARQYAQTYQRPSWWNAPSGMWMNGFKSTQNSMMYPYSWWNSMTYPSWFSQNWLPGFNYGWWNSMRYPRDSDNAQPRSEQEQPASDRPKRDTSEIDRRKRWNQWWNQNSMMYPYSWWNSMSYPSWNFGNWFSGSNDGWNTMRYPRELDNAQSDGEQEESGSGRSKRETLDLDRIKRWNQRWNQNSMMYPYSWWNSMRYPSWNFRNWFPGSNNGWWNSMRYPRHSDDAQSGSEQEQSESFSERSKRETPDSDRSKRWNQWWNQNSMMYPYSWWNSMRYPSGYSQYWFPSSNFGWWNSMRYPRDSADHQSVSDQEQSESSSDRSKRHTSYSDRNKRWNQWWKQNSKMYPYSWWNSMRYPSGYSRNWFPSSNFGWWNSMRYPRDSDDATNDSEQEPSDRPKRDTSETERRKRWNQWWNHSSMMYPYSWWNSMSFPPWNFRNWFSGSNDGWNSMRYPRELDNAQSDGEQEESGSDRSKRETPDIDRSKRWNQRWNQNSMMYPYSWWNSMRDPTGYWFPSSNFGWWNSMRYPRDSDGAATDSEQAGSAAERSKRDISEIDRTKRWNQWWNHNSMMYLYSWWNSMRYPSWDYRHWFPRNNNGWWNSMRYPRHSDDVETNIEHEQTGSERPKRDTSNTDRSKRWNQWWNQNSMMYPYSWWNSMRYPSGYSRYWFPNSNYGWWNSMRYPRHSDDHETGSEQEQTASDRSKRETPDIDRSKRWNQWWNQNSMMYPYSWWNSMRYPSWNFRKGFPGSNNGWWNSMRFPRHSDDAHSESKEEQGASDRSKRDTSDIDRNKRWNQWWNQNSMMYPYSWWNSMSYPSWDYRHWFPGSNNGWWNSMRYPRHSDDAKNDIEQEQTGSERPKRDTSNTERSKRWNQWWNQNSMMYPYSWWNSMSYPSWNFRKGFPGSNNGWWNSMRFPRHSDDAHSESKEEQGASDRSKRDTSDIDRNKRWNQWWNQNSMMYPYSWWNSMRDPTGYWFPSSNFGWWNSMRYPRDSDGAATDSEQAGSTTERSKRDISELDRTKRWNQWWNQNSMMYPYSWWNSMRYPSWDYRHWFPRNNNGWWNSMRYPRHSDDVETNIEHEQTGSERPKRDTSNTDRSKRWNQWWNQNSMMYPYSWWNSMRYPSGYSRYWFPNSNYGWWNSMRYPRHSDDHETGSEQEQTASDRSKRETPFIDRSKRWNQWWNQNSMMYPYSWWNSMRYPSWNFRKGFPGSNNGWWNSMRFPRHSDDAHSESKEEQGASDRSKRDTSDIDRNKRWNQRWNQNSMMYPYSWWNSMSYPSWDYRHWFPGSNNGWWNSMRYPRHSDDAKNDIEQEQMGSERPKRDTSNTERSNRWNQWWNQNSMMYPYSWWNSMSYPSWNFRNWFPGSNNGWWNSMRYPRHSDDAQSGSEQEQSESFSERSKRETPDSDRSKRWNQRWNQNSMMYPYSWWNSMSYPSWNFRKGFHGSNNGWWNSMRFPRHSDDAHSESKEEQGASDRSKRDTSDIDRNKRWNQWWNQNSMMYPYSWWNSMRDPTGYWFPSSNFGWWNSMRYPRDSDGAATDSEQAGSTTERSKRDISEIDRTKRWNQWWNQNSMMYPYSWWNSMRYPSWDYRHWFPRNNNGWWNSMRYPRHSDDVETNIEHEQTGSERPKRDTSNTDRSKRWNQWWNQNSMMYPYSWWNSMRYPSGYSRYWFPNSNYGWWNSMRYPRHSDDHETGSEQEQTASDRSKRETPDIDRSKRWNQWWNQNSMMYPYSWWNSMRYPSWNFRKGFPGSNNGWWNSMRFPRHSDDAHSESKEEQGASDRSKRDTSDIDRNKRWNQRWNQNSMMYPYSWWNSMSYPSWDYRHWFPGSNNGWWNSMRYPRHSDDAKNDIEQEQMGSERPKRDTSNTERSKRWNQWWNQNSMMYPYSWWNSMSYPSWNFRNWFPGSNNGWWNSMRYPRHSDDAQSGSEQEQSESFSERSKRETPDSDRSKRWNQRWNQNSMMYPYSWWNSMSYPSWNFRKGFPGSNNGWWNSMRFPRHSDDAHSESKEEQGASDRSKRDTSDIDRNKRWNQWWNQNSMMYPYSWWNSMRDPTGYWFPSSNFGWWNSMRYPRDSDGAATDSEQAGSTTERSKRDISEIDRTKRWNQWWNQNSMMYPYSWWNSMRYPSWDYRHWFPRNNNGWWNSMRYPRHSDDVETNIEHEQTGSERPKRDTSNTDRSKRWNQWWNQNSMMYPYSWWNSMRYPSGYSRYWFPNSNYGWWNSMRYPRHSDDHETGSEQEQTASDRSKRETPDIDRSKRWNQWWNQNSMMYPYSWWNSMRYPSWNFRKGFPGSNNGWWNSMRFPRHSDDAHSESKEEQGASDRSKRDTSDIDRNKRWNQWWNQNSMMYPYSWWNSMSYPSWDYRHWFPGSNNGWWNSMRYPRHSDDAKNDIEQEQTGSERPKRDTSNTERSKRWNQWWNQNSMMYPYSWWNSMRYPSGYSRYWFPNSNYGWWNSMRYPRDTDGAATDSEQAESTQERSKRDISEIDRTKRWNQWWNQNSMMYPYSWWNSMSYPSWNFRNWLPGSNNGWWNSMRYPRHSDGAQSGSEQEQSEYPLDRSKRETPESDRSKRWNQRWNQNSMMYPYSWWNSMSYPSWDYRHWFPGSKNGWWNSMRYPRHSDDTEADIEQEQTGSERPKRDTSNTDRNKRWNQWWNQNSMMYPYSWWNSMRYPSWNFRKGFPGSNNGWWNSMRYPRHSDDAHSESKEEQGASDRSKRDTSDIDRNKRWNQWWNQNSMMYPYSWWNSMRDPTGYWFPSSNFGWWNSMRYTRDSDDAATDSEQAGSTAERSKRDISEIYRTKRWNQWWNQNSILYPYSWWNSMRYPSWNFQNWFPGSNNGWWNSMRYPRQSDDTHSEMKEKEVASDRSKRDTSDIDRNKRWNQWWNQNSMMYPYSWWNSMRYPSGYSRYWFPNSNYGWWNSMRYPRHSDDHQTGSEQEQTASDRSKRETPDIDRSKRWNQWWNQNSMIYPYSWWNSISYPSWNFRTWFPDSNNGWWNFMRFPRDSDGARTDNEQAESTSERSKRDTSEIDRTKRWNQWWNQNSMMYPYSWWNSMSYPSWDYRHWFPRNNNGWWNSMRYPRHSDDAEADIEQEQMGSERPKRDTSNTERSKRWNQWWNQNSMMYPYSWWNSMSYPSWNFGNWFSGFRNGWNSIRYPRDLDDPHTDIKQEEAGSERLKRDTSNIDRTKRWNQWSNQNSMMFPYSWWNSFRHPSWFSRDWIPGSNSYRFHSMRYPSWFPSLNDGQWSSRRYPKEVGNNVKDEITSYAKPKFPQSKGYRTRVSRNVETVNKQASARNGRWKRASALAILGKSQVNDNADMLISGTNEKQKRKRSNEKPIPMTGFLKSFLSNQGQVSKVLRTTLNGQSRRFSKKQDETRSKKRTWDSMARLMHSSKNVRNNGWFPTGNSQSGNSGWFPMGGSRSGNGGWLPSGSSRTGNRGWFPTGSSKTGNNGWFPSGMSPTTRKRWLMGWVIRHNNRHSACDPTSQWAFLCSQPFWYSSMLNSMRNAFNNYWMRMSGNVNDYNYNYNNMAAFPWWFPPLSRNVPRYPPLDQQSGLMSPWQRLFGNGFGSGGVPGNGNDFWNNVMNNGGQSVSSGWDPSRRPRDDGANDVGDE